MRDGGSRLPVSVSVIDYLVIVSPAPGYQDVALAERKDTRIELVGVCSCVLAAEPTKPLASRALFARPGAGEITMFGTAVESDKWHVAHLTDSMKRCDFIESLLLAAHSGVHGVFYDDAFRFGANTGNATGGVQ